MRRSLGILLAFSIVSIGAKGEKAHLYLQLGHSDEVEALAFSPDERLVLTGGSDGVAAMWDLGSGAEIRRFVGHTDDVTSVAFSPDQRLVLTASKDETARLWDAATGTPIRTFKGHEYDVWAVAFSPDGRFIVTGSEDKTARLWEVSTGREIRRFEGHSDTVWAVAFSPDGRLLLTGGGDSTARLWDIASGRELHRFRGEHGRESAVAFSPNGRYVVTGGEDHIARLWDITTGAEVRRFIHPDEVPVIRFSRDGRVLWTACADEIVRYWDVATGKEIPQVSGELKEMSGLSFAPSGRYLLTSNTDGQAFLWDALTGSELRRFEGNFSVVSSAAFSPHGQYILTGSKDHTAHIWGFSGGAPARLLAGHTETVTSAAFSPDSQFALTGSDDRTARLWNLATGDEVRRFVGHTERVLSVAFSPDGRYVLTGSWDKTARVWEVASGKEIRRFTGHFSAVGSVGFSRDGRLALTASWGAVRIWDIERAVEVRRFQISSETGIAALSPDGRFVLAAGFFEAELFDAATGQELRRFAAGRGDPSLHGTGLYVRSIAFSPDGRTILTGSDGEAALWDIGTGAKLRRLGDGASMVAYSPDGRFVLAASDAVTQIYDAATGNQVAILAAPQNNGWVVLDSQGRYDASDPDNMPGLHFVAGNDVIELGQLKQRFYTPGLLGRIWRGERLPAISGELNDISLVPGVEVRAPMPNSTVASVHLTNRSGGIGKVIVKVNGRELPSATRDAVANRAAATADLTVDLSDATLAPDGKNVIEVFAENGDGVVRSRGVAVPWERLASNQAPAPRLFAIVVGTSVFDNPNMNLGYPAKDAEDFSHALGLASRGLFGNERTRITVLASDSPLEPTKSNISAAFEAVASEAQPSDLLVVYFAGHGAAARNEQDQYYYFTREARSTEVDRDPSLRALSTISSTELKQWLGRRNMPLKQVVILDTCAAGAAFGDVVKLAEGRDLSPDQVRAIEFLKDATGSWILMGSAADAVSYEANRYAQGLLTYALLQGMQGQALDEDRVEVGRLLAFAQRQVVDLAKGIGGIQQPLLSAPKGQTFPIGLLSAAARQEIHLAIPKPELLRARVIDDNDLDRLKLEPAVRAALHLISLPVTRGNTRQEPPIVYLDSVVDDTPDALIPQVRYKAEGAKVTARLRLLRAGAVLLERTIEFNSGSADEIGRELAATIVNESGKVK